MCSNNKMEIVDYRIADEKSVALFARHFFKPIAY